MMPLAEYLRTTPSSLAFAALDAHPAVMAVNVVEHFAEDRWIGKPWWKRALLKLAREPRFAPPWVEVFAIVPKPPANAVVGAYVREAIEATRSAGVDVRVVVVTGVVRGVNG